MAMMNNFQFSIFNFQKPAKRGFALLISVIFMSVMLALGIALSSLAYKQQVLASSATESQYAFYAADTALECALYGDQQNNLFAYQPIPVPPATDSVPNIACDNSAPFSTSVISHTASQWAITNRLKLDNNTRCADVTVYKSVNGTTYIFAQGYSVSCATVVSPNGGRFSSRGIRVRY